MGRIETGGERTSLLAPPNRVVVSFLRRRAVSLSSSLAAGDCVLVDSARPCLFRWSHSLPSFCLPLRSVRHWYHGCGWCCAWRGPGWR